MSQDNVELLKALYPPPGTDIAALFRDEERFRQLREAVGPFLTDDFESVMEFPGETRTYQGVDGFRKNWLDWLAPWATYTSTIEELIDAGESVLLLLRDRGRREDMDVEVELVGATTCAFRDGKIARWVDYAERADALKAVGLSE